MPRVACNKPKQNSFNAYGSAHRTEDGRGRRKCRSMEKPAAFPQTLEIETTDFHIPSAPATIANIDIQKPKGAFPSLPTVLLQAHPSIGKDWEGHPGPLS